MKNYFDHDPDAVRPEPNEDYWERTENRPRAGTLQTISEYDRQYVNRILNYDLLTEADRQNIADVLNFYMYELEETREITKSFEDFIMEVMGTEWFDNMTAAWLRRKNNELAAKWGMPELLNNKGVFFIDPKNDREE